MTADNDAWKPCSACKTPLAHGAQYYVCNVSTCNRKRTGMQFCSVSCWEVHLPIARHREAWAEERVAPSRAEATREREAAQAALDRSSGRKPSEDGSKSATRSTTVLRRRGGDTVAAARAGSAPTSPTSSTSVTSATSATSRTSAAAIANAPREVLIVASRLKDYVRAVSGFNTSDRALEPLSDIVRDAVERAIENAREDERKTVLDRDVPKPPRD